MFLLLACAGEPVDGGPTADDSVPHDSGGPGDSGSETDSGEDTGTADDTGSSADTASDDTGVIGHPLEFVLSGMTSVVDGVEAADGGVYVSGVGPDGPGVYRWDGTLALALAHEDPGPLAASATGEVYARLGSQILAISTGAAVSGVDGYGPGALDVIVTEAGDRLTFPGEEPSSGAVAVYTVKATGGAVAVVGEGYDRPLRWVFRPEGETCWALDDDGRLWLVAPGEDIAAVLAEGFPLAGLTGDTGGSTLFLAGGRSLTTYDVATGTATEVALDLEEGEVQSLHRSLDARGGLIGVTTGSGASVYRLDWP
jgi:hypothetical protein